MAQNRSLWFSHESGLSPLRARLSRSGSSWLLRSSAWLPQTTGALAGCSGLSPWFCHPQNLRASGRGAASHIGPESEIGSSGDSRNWGSELHVSLCHPPVVPAGHRNRGIGRETSLRARLKLVAVVLREGSWLPGGRGGPRGCAQHSAEVRGQ